MIYDIESIVMVSKNGLIIQFKIESKEIEPVAMIEGGVLGAAWSPS